MKKLFLVPLICVAMFLPGIRTLAAVNPPTECPFPACDGILLWGSGQSEHHVENHTYCNDQTCTVTCVTTPVWKVCPNGHGVVWSGVCYEEFHSCSSARNIKEYR